MFGFLANGAEAVFEDKWFCDHENGGHKKAMPDQLLRCRQVEIGANREKEQYQEKVSERL